MSAPQKQCPQCAELAALDAAFCGQCGRQYRTQFVPPSASDGSSGGFAVMEPFTSGKPAVWLVRSSQAAVALLVCLTVLMLSGVFRRQAKPGLPEVTAVAGAHRSVSLPEDLPSAARRALSDDPVETAARRAVERESQKLDLAPPKVSEDGKIHLRSGGTVSKEEWEAARRKAEESPILREPPKPPPL